MNDLDYHLDYDISRFSGDNVTTSGSVRYEEKKYAADPSFHTWQSGSWVNTGGPSRETTSAGDIWAPGAKNSTLEIGKDSTETSLNLGQTYAYTEKQEDDEFPQPAYQEYAFDLAWYVLDQGIPYSLPPRPPVVNQDSNETSIDDGTSGASITYFDPNPSTSEKSYGATHSADWRWDSSGGLNPGWNYTYADRRTDVGEFLWNTYTGWTFEKETDHQLSLSTAFCIYQEDESVCDTPDCPNCVQSTSASTTDSSMGKMSATGKEIKSDLQSCCTLEMVTRPISVSKEHLESAKGKARDHAKPFLNNPQTQFEAEAARGWEQASEMDTDFRSLVAYRSASAHGRGIGVRQSIFKGKINANNAANRASQMVNKASATAEKIRYTGESLDAVIGEIGQIEKAVLSAISWADNATRAFEIDRLSDDEQLKYGESGLEFSAGNLNDAEYYIKSRKAGGSKDTEQSDALQSLYDSLHSYITDELNNVRGDLSDHVEYARDNAVSHMERAKTRKSDDFFAAAVVDLLYAYGYASAIPALRSAEFDDVDEEKLEVEQELTADHYNRRATNDLMSAERLLLRMASLEYNSGIESFGTFRAMDDQSEAERAYRHAIVTEEFLNATNALYEEFNLS